MSVFVLLNSSKTDVVAAFACEQNDDEHPGLIEIDEHDQRYVNFINPAVTTLSQYEYALDSHLDAVAKLHRYDNRFTFALRAGYQGPFQEEGIKFAVWMDQCNAAAYQLLADVQNGDRPMPSVGDFIAALPPSPF